MRVLYLTGREREYSRNEVLLRAFQHFADVDVISARDHGNMFYRSGLVFAKAFPKLLHHRADLIFIGFYGHLLMLPMYILRRSPVLFDAFVSNYDTLAFDRKTVTPGSLRGYLAFQLDRISCSIADRILLDTPQHVDYFRKMFRIPPEKFISLPVGCNEDIFYPQMGENLGSGTQVLYYSTYLPLHGVETVVRAAQALQSKTSIHFKLVGNGQEFTRIQSLVQTLHLENVELLPSVPLYQLPGLIASSDICLGGHFGESAKAGRVVPGKVYQILAMQRALIATTTPANSGLLSHRINALLVSPSNYQSLAEAICELSVNESFRRELAEQGRKVYEQRCSEAVIQAELRFIVEGMLDQG